MNCLFCKKKLKGKQTKFCCPSHNSTYKWFSKKKKCPYCNNTMSDGSKKCFACMCKKSNSNLANRKSNSNYKLRHKKSSLKN